MSRRAALAKLREVYAAWEREEAEANDVMDALATYMRTFA